LNFETLRYNFFELADDSAGLVSVGLGNEGKQLHVRAKTIA